MIPRRKNDYDNSRIANGRRGIITKPSVLSHGVIIVEEYNCNAHIRRSNFIIHALRNSEKTSKSMMDSTGQGLSDAVPSVLRNGQNYLSIRYQIPAHSVKRKLLGAKALRPAAKTSYKLACAIVFCCNDFWDP